jgi:hypothetical protein
MTMQHIRTRRLVLALAAGMLLAAAVFAWFRTEL